MENKKSRIATFIEGELSNWKKVEILWLSLATLVILGVSISWGDSALGIFCSICGVFCVVLVGKGKLSNYFFGIINVSLYAFIAYEAGYYGDTMLNLIYYLPMNIIGIFLWKKHMNQGSNEVVKVRLPVKKAIALGAISVVSVGFYGTFLNGLGGNLPYIDSTSTVFSVVAQYLCAIRATEQWIFWIIVNIVSVYMWVEAFSSGNDSIATLLMWMVYLLNAIFMLISWYRDSKVEQN